MSTLRVEALRSWDSVSLLRADIDALDLASRRPCPFATFEYIETFLAHDEYGTKRDEILFLAAFEEQRLVGYLPLRKYRDAWHGVAFGRIGVLVSHDTDRPHVVARAEDEARCASAFYDHLLHREAGWSFLELAMQDGESALGAVPALRPFVHYARRSTSVPNTTIELRFASFAEYFASLGRHRHNLARLCRKLLAAGDFEVVSCDDPRGRRAMLDLYLDVERRSWKEAAHAGLRRDPRRTEFYRALCAPEQPFALGVDLLLLDGAPIAGLVLGSFAGAAYGLEMAFDEAYRDLGPGHVSTLASIRHAIERKWSSINFNGNYAYYKANLGGVVTETSSVQIYRVGSVPWIKARGGEIARRMRPPEELAQRFNPERRRVSKSDEGEGGEAAASGPRERPRLDEERARAQATFGALAEEGVTVTRVSGATLERALRSSKHAEAA